MIQGLLAGVLEHDRKLAISAAGQLLLHQSYSPPPTHSSSSTPSVSPLTSPMPASSPSSSTTSEQQQHRAAAPENQLRCPRCDSSNTKFCYYNNYNLTQPRHFCKTCRRYWTKGGALRNVPIGGGCRKAKPSIIPSKSGTAGIKSKAPPISTSDFLMINNNNKSLLAHDTASASNGAIPCWANSAHLLALLNNGGASGIQNPLSSNAFPFLASGRAAIKEEGGGGDIDGVFGAQNFMGLESSGQCGGPFWRNPNQQFVPYQQGQQQQAQAIFSMGEASAARSAAEIQELYQKIRGSVWYSSEDLQLPILGIAGGGSSGASATTTAFAAAAGTSSAGGAGVAAALMMQPAGSHSASEFGYWNPQAAAAAAAQSSWSGMPAVNGGSFP